MTVPVDVSTLGWVEHLWKCYFLSVCVRMTYLKLRLHDHLSALLSAISLSALLSAISLIALKFGLRLHVPI